MNLLDRTQLLKPRQLKREKVPLPEWGGDVWVRTMTGAERDDYEQEYLDAKKKAGDRVPNLRARLLVRTVCDEQGKPLLSQNDVDELGQQSADVLSKLFTVASRLNGLSKSDAEELEKN